MCNASCGMSPKYLAIYRSWFWYLSKKSRKDAMFEKAFWYRSQWDIGYRYCDIRIV